MAAPPLTSCPLRAREWRPTHRCLPFRRSRGHLAVSAPPSNGLVAVPNGAAQPAVIFAPGGGGSSSRHLGLLMRVGIERNCAALWRHTLPVRPEALLR